MMGCKERAFAPLERVSLEDLVPADRFYRHLERTLDLASVRALAAPYYAARGRPSAVMRPRAQAAGRGRFPACGDRPAAARDGLRHRRVVIDGQQNRLVHEVQRFGLEALVHELARTTDMPVADTLLSKSVMSEREPVYLGLYQGTMSHPEVAQYVESSDCVVLLGVLMTDINLGVYTAHLDPRRCIHASF